MKTFARGLTVAAVLLSVAPTFAQEPPTLMPRAATGTTTQIIVAGTVCYLVTNNSGRDYGVPNRTVAEFDSFVKAAESGQLGNVKVKSC